MDNDVVIDDPWVAAHHARIALGADGALVLQALQSRNGVQHEAKRLQGGEELALPAGGSTLQMGATRMRLRLPGEVLAEDKPLAEAGRRLQPLLLALVLMALLLAGQWIELDPGADFSTWLPLLMGLPVALVGWCASWALLSKLFQHRFDFTGHLRIALPWMLAITAAEMLLPQLAASLAAPWLWHLSTPLQGLLGALMVRAHLAHVLPQHPRIIAASVAALAVAAGVMSLALTYRSTDSWAAAPYMSTLPLPALRLAGTVPPERLVQDLAPVAAKLAERVKKARDDEAEASAEAPAEDTE